MKAAGAGGEKGGVEAGRAAGSGWGAGGGAGEMAAAGWLQQTEGAGCAGARWCGQEEEEDGAQRPVEQARAQRAPARRTAAAKRASTRMAVRDGI